MKRLGSQTRTLLQNLGLDRTEIESIEKGDMGWDLFPVHQTGAERSDSDLILTNRKGAAQRRPDRLSKESADELINTWNFERRQKSKGLRPSTFPVGILHDWTGIKPGSDWLDIIQSSCSGKKLWRWRPISVPP